MKNLFVFILSVFCCVSAFCAEFTQIDNSFPFYNFGFDKNSKISAFNLNTPITSENDRILVSDDGHLKANNQRIRIFGTNLSNIPDRDMAPVYADFLAAEGYNCIRFHHVDSSWTNAFLRKDSRTGKWVINEFSLDNFDFFVNELKKRGIYVNINLLTGRDMSSKDGLHNSIDKVKDWKHKHCFGFWNQEARDLQKQYAKDILTHVNPYTNLSYTEDPAIAIVEINNENGLVHGYLNNMLKDYDDTLWLELENKWNEYLLNNGLDFQTLSEKYNKTSELGKKLINETSKWNLERHQNASAKISKSGDLHQITIEKNGLENWHIQYNSSGLNMKNGQLYTIQFMAKANKPVEIDVSLNQAHDPWQQGGFHKKLNLTTQWQSYSFTTENVITDSNLRLNFGSMGFLKGHKIELKEILIYEGGNTTNIEKSTLNPNNVKLPRYAEYDGLPNEYKNLILNFMYDLEKDYWNDMLCYIRDELGSKSLMMGSAIGCTTLGLMNMFDIIDSHAYWNHPSFPNRDWDTNDFYVSNKDLAKDESGGTLTNLAGQRIYRKPFSVSEYDHPYPNQFNSQMYPMFASFASFQDWDCIYTFCSELPKRSAERITGFFDQTNNPVKTAAAPVASRIFRNALVTPAKTCVYVELDEQAERETLHKSHAWALSNIGIYGADKKIALQHQLGFYYKENKDSLPANAVNYESVKNQITSAKNGVFSDTNELYWNSKDGTYLVQNPNVSISVVNKNSILPTLPESWMQENMILPFCQKDDFATICAVKENNEWLIFACSWCGNENESLREYGKTSTLTSKLQFTRDEINLKTTMNPNGKVRVLCADGTLKINSNKKWYLTQFDDKGNVKKSPQTGKSFTLKKESGTLWFILSQDKQ